MRMQGEGLIENPSRDYFAVPIQLDRHEYLAGDCDFQKRMHTSSRVNKTFVGCNNVKVFVLWPHDRPKRYVLKTD